MFYAVILFALTYILMFVFSKYRPYIAIGSALIFIFTGMLPPDKILPSIDFNVILMLAGTMGIVALLTESKMPALLADIITAKVPNVKWAIITLSLFAGAVSALIDNVATVLMIAPIALAIARKLNANPINMIIAIAVSSNLQGAATLVGDTTSILLGGYADMGFLDFFIYKGKPGIFFAVELGALTTVFLLMFLFRKEKSASVKSERTVVKDFMPSVLIIAMIFMLITASFIPNLPRITNGVICTSLAVTGIVYRAVKKKNFRAVFDTISEIDFSTLILLIGLFAVVGGISETGVIDAAAQLFTEYGAGNLFVIYTAIVWISVLFSAFIDNIPYVAAMLPVTQGIAAALGIDPSLLYFGLLSGATLGGNLTPIGASANIAGISILQKEGFKVKNRDFLRIGVPFTLAAIIPAYIFIWIFYS